MAFLQYVQHTLSNIDISYYRLFNASVPERYRNSIKFIGIK